MLGAVLVAPGTAAADGMSAGGTEAARATRCAPVEHPFRPTSIRIPGVVGPTRVLALGRDRGGVPRTPPLSAAGRWQVAWDRASRVRPGSPYGVVRLNAHTYPWNGSAGTALGNRLLKRLRTGQQIEVSGPDGERMCYRVVRKMQARADRPLRAYYSNSSSPRLAILVCSGQRLGPGKWSRRTIWFAEPVEPGVS